ncbi:hypothetical protein [Lewinella sp. IMCC34191]|uniref:hypothetical protein n=1 Tax=Lewinella sp. IMCC34191 TaxID=2259172 RepID=UPI000E257FED|nr:hypothetical protein [Lewinella sp. IMCC34191]
MNLLTDWNERDDPTNLRRVEAFRSTRGMERYDTARAATFEHFLETFIRNKNRYDPELISRFSVPPHMQQSADQRNLQIEDLAGLKIVYREKVVLPKLEYFTVARDSFFLPLTPQAE